MSDIVETLLVAAAREFVMTRPVMIFWGERMFDVACAVAFRAGQRQSPARKGE